MLEKTRIEMRNSTSQFDIDADGKRNPLQNLVVKPGKRMRQEKVNHEMGYDFIMPWKNC